MDGDWQPPNDYALNKVCPVCQFDFTPASRGKLCGNTLVHVGCARCFFCGSNDWTDFYGRAHSYRIYGSFIIHESCACCAICNLTASADIMARFPTLFVLTHVPGHIPRRLYHASCLGCQCLGCEMEQNLEKYTPSGDWKLAAGMSAEGFADIAYRFERDYGGDILDPCCRQCTRCGKAVINMAAPQYTIDDYPVAHEVCKRCDRCMCKYKDNRDHVDCLPRLKMKNLSISTKKPRRVRHPACER